MIQIKNLITLVYKESYLLFTFLIPNLLSLYLVTILSSICIFSFAQTINKDSLIIVLKNANDDSSKVNTLVSIGWEYRSTDAQKAIQYTNDALLLSEQIYFQRGQASAYNNLGVIYYDEGNYKKAIEYYQKAMTTYEALKRKTGIALEYRNIGSIYYLQGNYEKALDYFNNSLTLNTEQNDKKRMAIDYGNIGMTFYETGFQSRALENYLTSLKIREEIGDKQGTAYVLNNIGIVYDNQKNYLKATEIYKKSMQLCEELNDKRGIAALLINIGTIYLSQDDYATALEYIQKSLSIYEEISYKNGIASALITLGDISLSKKKYEQAIDYTNKAIAISKEIGDRKNISFCKFNLGAISEAQFDLNKAYDYYNEALIINKQNNAETELAKDYQALAKVLYKQAKFKEASENFLKAKSVTLKLLKDNFSILSESEKELYLEQTMGVFNGMNEFALLNKQTEKMLTTHCYDNELLLKGLLLNGTRGMMTAVNKSNDTTMINSFWRLKQLRNEIGNLQSMTPQEREKEISPLETLANEEERKLVKMSSTFADIQNQFNYSWLDVQQKLKKEDAAIEFVRIKHTITKQDTLKKDSITYAALIIRPGYVYPVMVSLFEEKNLQNIFTNKEKKHDQYFIADLYNYEKDSCITKHDNAKGKLLYNLIWLPIEGYLTDVTTVYYAPAGILNRISFAVIPYDKDSLLSDKYELNELSSTREIIRKRERFFTTPIADTSNKSNSTAVVYGGIRYDLKPEQIQAIEATLKTSIGYPEKAKTINSTWDYLPGTYNEAVLVKNLFEKNKITTQLITSSSATEESFKQYNNTLSPDILHISTHGFFYPEPDATTSYKTQNSFKMSHNPLWRAGLVFAGGNYYWQTNEKIDKVEDGILTAYEISNVNLSNTKLAVLSACESGLGDIKGIEGVFGLQRAFKIAGVEYVIVSLWKVPDEQTAELMSKFYENWFSGTTIREAFRKAQNEMRKKYDPYYWAAFVLIE